MRRVSAPHDHIAIIGAGTSALALDLARAGTARITALDISAAALDRLKAQLGDLAAPVEFVVTDVRLARFDTPVDVWHDRATFHFLTTADDQLAYAERVADAVRHGGHLVLAGFAPTGPEQCSGLPVARHSVETLAPIFREFLLVDSFEQTHLTPWGSEQRFLHTLWQRG